MTAPPDPTARRWWQFWKPRRWEPARIVPPPGFWCGDSICEFAGRRSLDVDDGVLVPMQSGRTMLYRVAGVRTPSDPGDQHFYRMEKVRYV